MRRSLRVLVPALLALSAVACAETFQAGAAVVNGVPISTDELERQLDAQAGADPTQPGLADEARIRQARQILVQLIQAELIRQEGLARDLDIPDSTLDEQMELLRQGQPEEEFRRRVEEAGFTLESLREQIRLRALVDQIRAQLDTDVTDEEVRQVYELSRQQFEQAVIRHIVFAVGPDQGDARAERRARATRVELQAGASFGALARERSDAATAENGGRLPGWTTIAQLQDLAFAAAVAEAEIGEVTEPVRAQDGWHLILVTGRRTQPFREVRQGLRDQLEQQASDTAFQGFLTELLADADVEVNPRYGDWDPETASIVPHTFFTRPEPETDPLAPAEGDLFPTPAQQ